MTTLEDDNSACLQKKPDDEALLKLLNNAFDGWGSREYFEWKYDRFPNYDPSEHNFIVTTATGKLIGARRVFERRLQRPDGETALAHVHGGTAVHEDHRGKGHYSDLLRRSNEYSRQRADCLFTFNRSGKITTDHHEKNGWNYIILPVFVKPLSPLKVASNYVFDNLVLQSITDKLSSADRHLTKSEIVSRWIAASAGQIYGRNRQTVSTARTPSTDYVIDVVEDPGEELIEQLDTVLTDMTNETYTFERSKKAIRHSLLFPSARLILARKKDQRTIAGFAVAGHLNRSGLIETRVLEQAWNDPAVTQRLLARVENDAREFGADVVVACSEHQPSKNWIEMGTEYMMWPPGFSTHEYPVSQSDWRITAGDIL